ncbi:hypothetical protein BCF55_0847 [Hydrogenivirga caldilitoris]|uniref:Uncharacterized protein n=1 Tax=Hydrogenivirga caldilitoris TaxID=246264 RepID=A0A497XQL3_9AQUI|nr:hypothetical protein [Hydrogenivirga caldilitoris]RLJ70571.1 hypothetical protein BCF55_0847 [Hydrogenivirga caldilitoris]
MLISELSKKQRDFLKGVFELSELPEEAELREFLREKGCELYECMECGSLIFHDNYEFWNLSECCDDNSKLTQKGLLCEVCYAKSPENMKYWVAFRPSWYKDVDFNPNG